MIPPLGRLLSVNGCNLHIQEQGSGPAVILEAGIAGSSLSWASVQPRIAQFAHVISYDRAGLGWSGRILTPRSVGQMISDLSNLLSQSGAKPPYVLVGHSYGALLVRAYAVRKPVHVAGLILLDPVSVEQWATASESELRRLATGARLARRGALLARTGVIKAALALLLSGNKRVPRLIANVSAGKGTSVVSRLTGEMSKLPPAVWPAICAHWNSPKCFLAMADYLESLPESARTVANEKVPPQIPVTILSATTAKAGELAEREQWVRQSSCGQHIRLDTAGHWVQLDEPEVVIAAVRDMVNP